MPGGSAFGDIRAALRNDEHHAFLRQQRDGAAPSCERSRIPGRVELRWRSRGGSPVAAFDTGVSIHRQDAGYPITDRPLRAIALCLLELGYTTAEHGGPNQQRNRSSEGATCRATETERQEGIREGGRSGRGYGTLGSRGSINRATPSAIGHVSSILDKPLTLTSIRD